MPSLKSLRMRINSVKSTRKITQAMKMVAAAKLRRAQSRAEAARPYAERMERMLASLGDARPGLLASVTLAIVALLAGGLLDLLRFEPVHGRLVRPFTTVTGLPRWTQGRARGILWA